MSGVHDLGGRPHFGPVPVGDDHIFAADWERRAFGVTQFAQSVAGFNTDAFRHGIEREDPGVYPSISYFDKWIRNGERMLVEGGVLAPDAVTARLRGVESTGPVERTTNARPAERPGAERAPARPPRFAVGNRVRVATQAPLPGTHTRLPDYVAGRVGTVVLVNGGWVFPDSHAHGRGEQPCWVYAVRFAARELWSDSATDHAVHVDLFEPYLHADASATRSADPEDAS